MTGERSLSRYYYCLCMSLLMRFSLLCIFRHHITYCTPGGDGNIPMHK